MAAAAKLAFNAGIPAIMQMMTEQFRIVAAHGIAAEQMAALPLEVNYGNRLIGSYGPIIAEKRFEPAGFPMRLGRKDVGLALAAAGDAALPLTALIAGRMDAWTRSSPLTVRSTIGLRSAKQISRRRTSLA